MSRYEVQMTRLAVVYRKETVEAETLEEAEELAKSTYGDEEDGWELNGIYDDGKPYCALAVETTQVDDDET